MNIKTITPPTGLLEKLERAKLNYSTAVTLFYLVWTWTDGCVGVFGDGDNGAYEWFVFANDKLTHSDCGFGDTAVALKEALNQVSI